MNTIQFGVHYMLDGYGASPESLKDINRLTSLLTTLPEEMGMHTISEPVVVEVGEKNEKDPGGISGFVMIAESHLSFHTFPNRGFATIDVYTCQNDLDTEALSQKLVAAFGFTEKEEHVIKRGTKYPIVNIH